MAQSEEKFRESNRAEFVQQVINIKFYLDLIVSTVEKGGDKLNHDDLVCTLEHLGALETGAELIWSQTANKIIGRTELPNE